MRKRKSSTNATVSSWPVDMPSVTRSMTRNLEMLDKRTVNTMGGHCSALIPVAPENGFEALELFGAEAFGRGRDLGSDGLAVIGQGDELHRQRCLGDRD
jgi:hypothetical protein